MQTKATRGDYDRFLLRAYFGEKCLSDPKAACIDRAYLDFSRTLRGIAELPEKQGVHERAVSRIRSAITELRRADISNQKGFDAWHRSVCMSLKEIYRHGRFEFYVGQAQKWINMTMKYIYTFGDEGIPGFAAMYAFCHVPLDKTIVGTLVDQGSPKLTQPWSRVDDYDQYLSYQTWIRQTFLIAPLDLELFAWMAPGFNFDNHRRPTPAAEAST